MPSVHAGGRSDAGERPDLLAERLWSLQGELTEKDEKGPRAVCDGGRPRLRDRAPGRLFRGAARGDRVGLVAGRARRRASGCGAADHGAGPAGCWSGGVRSRRSWPGSWTRGCSIAATAGPRLRMTTRRRACRRSPSASCRDWKRSPPRRRPLRARKPTDGKSGSDRLHVLRLDGVSQAGGDLRAHPHGPTPPVPASARPPTGPTATARRGRSSRPARHTS